MEDFKVKDYKVKDIIFGLRGEYQKAYKKISALKENVSFYDNGQFDLYLSRINERSKPAIMYQIYMNEKKYKSDMKETYGGTLYEPETDTFYGKKIFLINNQNEFKDKVDEILNLEFTQEMCMCEPDDIKRKDKKIDNLVVWDNLIDYIKCNKKPRIQRSVQYSAVNDKIHVETYRRFQKVDETMLAKLLEEEVPERFLKKYHKELIDRYKPKDIVISNFPMDTKCDSFEIIEDDEKILLRR